ncbi:Inositol polyphosphate 5-phosphatase OCRL-1 [Grifola frondosa]|uniref:Inositol polyphosphate 5-phosphatase OCRL-1 n=1 Tax=Grifola frondosa TaxID=5627 RepID=A0A1C7MPV1_GRIFR|nr:Inositol polyphosphate 5-phosphatase OCRL-1 [Grifola frondosa]
MSRPLDSILQDILLPSEEVKVAIEARAPDTDSDLTGLDAHFSHDAGPESPRKKILAVVSHVHPARGQEQGCVFVFHPKPSQVQSTSDDYVVEHVFPVFGDFSISMSQPRRSTMDLRSASAGNVSILNQPRTELTLTIKPGHDPAVEPISLLTNDIQGLRSVLAECKRLKNVYDTQDEPDFEPFAWVAPYVMDGSLPLLLSPIPPDLRQLHKPLHSLLSPASAGMSGDDAFDIAMIREDWMRRKVRENLASTGCKFEQLKIRVGTFNVNGKFPSQDLSAWLGHHSSIAKLIPPLKEMSPLSLREVVTGPPNEIAALQGKASADAASLSINTSSTIIASTTQNASRSSIPISQPDAPDVIEDTTDPDLIVLAFQELDLSAEALLYSTKTMREDAWCVAAFAGLGEKAVMYEKLVSKQLVGMLLVVIAKKRLKSCFNDIKSASVGAGIMGIMGNKGATALRLQFTPSLFPSSEASAARPISLTFVNSHLAAFDEMFEKRNLDFHDLSKRLIFDSGIPLEDPSSPGALYAPATVPLNVYETDALFWMLMYAMRHGRAFEGFMEHPVSYPPSYRFGAGALSDSQGYDTKRKPAWTDRILYMVADSVSVKQLEYTSHSEITMSDHRPVSAEFDVKIPAVDDARYETFVQRIWRDVAEFENSDERPNIKISDSIVEFGKISYNQCVSRTIELENIGKVPCAFRFVSPAPGTPICPEWLKIERMTGLVLPGEKIIISLSALVENATAARLNLAQTHLEDTLVLHTALGRDHFISITGDYQRTCFATSLAWLVRLPGPVRTLKSQDDLLPEGRAINAPREIMKLVNWLMSNATDVTGLFVTKGEDELVTQIRECLDTGAEFVFGCSETEPRVAWAVADTLVRLLESLSEPVVPASLHARCIQMTSRDEAFELLDAFPTITVNVWISITAFLHFIGQQQSSELDTEQLAVLLRDDEITATPVSVVGKRNYLRYFLS